MLQNNVYETPIESAKAHVPKSQTPDSALYTSGQGSGLTEGVWRAGRLEAFGLLKGFRALHQKVFEALAGLARRYLREVDRPQDAHLALELVVVPLPVHFALESIDVLPACLELFLQSRRRLGARLLHALQILLQPRHLVHQLTDLQRARNATF